MVTAPGSGNMKHFPFSMKIWNSSKLTSSHHARLNDDILVALHGELRISQARAFSPVHLRIAMVTTRRTRAPSSPPNLSAARAVPDDPPPTPPMVASFDMEQQCNVLGGKSPQNVDRDTSASYTTGHALARQGASVVVVASRQPATVGDVAISGAAMNKLSRNSERNMPQMRLVRSPTKSANQAISLAAASADDASSDSPDEEPSSAAMSLVRAQMEQERLARMAVVEERRARRRARVATPVMIQRAKMEMSECLPDARPPVLLPDNVLRAVEGAIGERRKSEWVQRQEERLRTQKRKVGRGIELKVLGGIQIAVTSSERKAIAKSGRRGRLPAAAFLQASMRNPGLPRVSAKTAARIAAKANLTGQ